MKMRAVVCERYGPPEVLRIQEVERPVPKDNEVRVRVCATTASTGDCELRRFDLPLWLWLPARIGFGIRGPRSKILGQELAGEVDAVGRGVRRFREGDRIFARTGFSMGAYAEYACLPEDGPVAAMPANVSFEEAAPVPMGGLEALHFLRAAGSLDGREVLINGAGGSIGTFAVQIAKAWGAEVTAVDSHGKLDMLRSIGADRVIDYRKEDFTTGGEAYDVIFDVVGGCPFDRCLRSVRKGGAYLMANPGLSQMARGRWTSRTSSRRVVFGAASDKAEDLAYLGELMASGEMSSVIDRRYPLEEAAEAHRYVEQGQKKGSVVLTVGPCR